MNVTHDLIAAVTGPGWKYGLSRILLNDEGQGVVFVAPNEPLAQFTVRNSRTSRGAGYNEDGEITWRRRGSSCQYKLAKCKIPTATMTGWWEDYLAEPAEEPPPAGKHVGEPEPDDTVEMEPVPDGSAAVVMAWVGDDMERAQAALDAENEGKQRVG